MPYRLFQLNRVKAWAVIPAGAWSFKMPLVAAVLLGSLAGVALVAPVGAQAPVAATAPAGGSQRGTVKTISGSTLTLTTDGGKQITANVADSAKILQIAPGSTDLKTAQTIALTDISVGDRVLVTGKAAESGDAMAASRVILMKSTDIAQRRAAEQADWTKRGSGGIVSSVDASSGTVTVASGVKKIQVMTTGKTIFRRYAGDSVKFEDAASGTIAQIQPGDQVRVRGTKSEDGSSIQAEEIVSGSFLNLSGTVASVGAGTVTLNDLATKKKVVVKVTANSDFRKLPPQAAAMFAARSRGGAAGGAGRPAGPQSAGSAGTGGGESGGRGQSQGAGQGGGSGMGGGGRAGGMDLAQMISRLPTGTLGELKAGDALMIVASQSQPGAGSVTAITMLSGVEPILAASPTGAAPAITLSPFGFGGGAPEMGGGSQ